MGLRKRQKKEAFGFGAERTSLTGRTRKKKRENPLDRLTSFREDTPRSRGTGEEKAWTRIHLGVTDCGPVRSAHRHRLGRELSMGPGRWIQCLPSQRLFSRRGCLAG